jgi:5'-nucleotidase
VILLVNDDGIDAPGLRTLFHALRSATRLPVLAVAPLSERSGQSQAITLRQALTVGERLDGDFYGLPVDGTPADCVKLALDRLLPAPPRLVVSGINDGPNVGRSIFYSGTCGAANEAAIAGHTALAVSRMRGPGGFADAAACAAGIAARLLDAPGLAGRVVNLNLPAGPASAWRPLRRVRHGLGGFHERYASGPTGAYDLVGDWVTEPADGPEADDAALLSAGHPVVSVLRPDLNDDAGLRALAGVLS